MRWGFAVDVDTRVVGGRGEDCTKFRMGLREESVRSVEAGRDRVGGLYPGDAPDGAFVSKRRFESADV